VVQGHAQPLGSLFPIPHGVVCGTLMATVNKLTLNKIINDNLNNVALVKYATIGSFDPQLYGVDNHERAIAFVDKLEILTKKLNIKCLSGYGVTEQHLDLIVSKTGLKNHPIQLTSSELKLILKKRL
ncbi:MAG: iron-containing alcohol dehydrogenase, partial [Bacteroidales bacterium]|nr:iron-containing alcohol dehydrogenase [Bacteroidales bacterium]